MAERTITSANSVVTLRVPGLFNTPQRLRGYSADRAWSTDGVDLAETQMGIDGHMSIGFVFNSVDQTFTLQADSESRDFFNQLIRATKAARESYVIYGTITISATGESFVCNRGVLKNAKAIPDAAKTLQPVDYVITWESISPTLS